MTDTNAPALSRAEMLERATETLKGLDNYALGIVADRARLALDVQEGTKAAILNRLRGEKPGSGGESLAQFVGSPRDHSRRREDTRRRVPGRSGP